MYTIREIGENIKDSKDFNGEVFFDFPMSKRTTMRVGGNADVIFEPYDEESLSFVLSELCANGKSKDFYVLGGGSNLVVCDNGVKKPIVSLRKLKKEIEILDGEKEGEKRIKCSSGLSWAEVFKFCTENKFGGLCEFAGLPGTVGGACFMNASCFGSSISAVLESAEYMSEKGERLVYTMNKDDWDYKKSPFATLETSKKIVTSATFRVYNTDEDIHSLGLGYIEKRKEKGHYKKPCAGSAFKNPSGQVAGKLIDECGLKGYKIGGAMVAPWHANIIINENNATQYDISKLMDYIVSIVREKKNIELIPEIIFW